jgi:hypothetical protein
MKHTQKVLLEKMLAAADMILMSIYIEELEPIFVVKKLHF